MPRSRSSRSASPLTQRSQESPITNDREQIFQQVKEIFQSTLDDVIVRMVLIECNWRDEIAIDKLLAIAEDAEAQNLYKQNESKLRKIAEGVLGPISFEDYKRHGSVRGPSIPDSKLSASARIIGRPVKHEERTRQPYSTPNEPQGSLVARGSNYLHPHVIPKSDVSDVDFPKLPSKSTAPASAFSSESSQSQQVSKIPGTLFQDSSFISQAQSAYNQQFDDAASAQRWEEVKEKLSEHYVGNLEQSQTDKTRTKTGRNFPVRLLNKDNDREGAVERARKLSRLDSADLDESILRGIYEVSSDPIEEVPTTVKKSGSGAGTPRSSTPGHGTPSPGHGAPSPGHGTPSPANVPMTLPVIGLSVEAVEFVPRSKPSKVDDKSGSTEPLLSSPKPVTSKTSRSNPIEIKSGARNIKSAHSPGVQFGSPASPTVSPGVGQHMQGRTTPVSSVSSSHLTGSPVFMTYKWPQGLHCVTAAPSHQSPILTGPRYIGGPPPQPRLTHATPFRLRGAPTPMSYQPGQVVYPMTQPPFFRMAGVSPHQMAPIGAQHVRMPRLATDLEERAAIATGSPIMANTVGDQQRTLTKTTGKGGKLISPAWISQWTQTIKDKQKAGKRVLVIVRGLPGSGKSTLSRGIQMDGVVLSTDDFFIKGGYYTFNPEKLSESHQWNRERAKEAIKLGTSPIIIDNTNTQKWEFSSYVNMAINNNYHVEIIEPETPWKFKPNELAKRTVHGIPKEHIQRMMSRYEHNITVDMIIGKGKLINAADKKSYKETAVDPVLSEVQWQKMKYRDMPGTLIQTKKLSGEAVDADTSALNEEKSDNVKQKDNRSWDLNEEKAAHLSRHLDDQSRASTPDAISDSSLPQASPDPDVHNRSPSPSSTVDHTVLHSVDNDISTSRTSFKTMHEDPQQNEILRDQTIMTKSSNNQSHVKKEPPPSLKFEKTISLLKMNKTVLHQNKVSKGRKSPTTSDIHENKLSSVKSKLSADTLKEIDDMLEVYMTDTNLSKDELNKREEELGALLQLLPINAEELNAAEILIHLRLHKSCVQGGDEDCRNESVEDETEVLIKLSDDDKSIDERLGHNDDDVYQVQNVVSPAGKVNNTSFTKSEGTYIVEEIASSVAEEKSITNAVSEMQIDEQELVTESMKHGVKDIEVKTDQSDDLKDQSVVSDIPKTELCTESQEKETIVDETDILKETEHDCNNVSVNSQNFTDNIGNKQDEKKHEDCSQSVNNTPVFQELSDIELHYWNKLNTKVVEHPEVVDTKWNDAVEMADDWVDHQEGQCLESPVVELVKPQRERKQKNVNKKNANDESLHEDSEIKSSQDDIVTVSNKSQQNQNVDISENSVNNNCSKNDEFDEVNEKLEVTGSKIIVKEENHDSECEDVILKQKVVSNSVKDAIEVLDVNTVGHEDLTMRPQTDHACLNSCESASCSPTESAVTGSINLPSVHNSSLDLLKEGYADMDIAEKDPVPTQWDAHGRQISMKPGPVLNITPQNTETTLGVDDYACNDVSDTCTEAKGALLVMDEHKVEAAHSKQTNNSGDSLLIVDKQTIEDANSKEILDIETGDSLLTADKPTIQVGDSIEVLNKQITDSGDSILAMRKDTAENCDSIEVLDKHVTETEDSKEVLDKHTAKNSGTRDKTDKKSQSSIHKKNSQRKLAAVFPQPLLTKEEKQKLFTKDWTSLNVTPKSPNLNNTQRQDIDSPELIDIATMTCDKDFRNSDNLSRGGFVDSSVKYLIGTSKKIININHTCSTESPVIPKVYLIDKSTSIDDLKDMSYSESVGFLKTCFPNVREDELECVLVNCHDNVEWAINLLLDWKYSMHLSEEEKQGFEEGIEKLKQANEPVRQPSSLTDICFELIEQNNIASRDELESQLIETSKGRLDRIEDDNINKIRLHRSTSLNESTDEGRDSLSSTANWSPSDMTGFSRSLDHSDKNGSVGFKRSDNQKMIDTVEENADESDESSKEDKAVNSQINEHLDKESTVEDELVFMENGLDSNDSVVDIESRIDLKDKKLERIKSKVEMKEFGSLKTHTNETWSKGGDSEEVKQDEDGFSDEGDVGTPALTISLPRDSVLQLQKMFGRFGSETDASDMLVPLDHGTALKLYQCIKHGVNYRKQLQLQKDEEMARALQEHEDSFASSQRVDNLRSRINVRQRKYVPYDDRRATIQPQEASSTGPVSLPIKSFESIMQEEEEEQKKKQEFQKLLVSEGGPSSMSTRVKRSQLYDKFPTVDRSAIDGCFEANCFNMTETEEAIRWALGHPEERSVNQGRDQEAPLIESTKQQSIQEMLDSYLYKPHATKDYQDGAYPNYEDYRGEANLHIRMRHECFQKAQAAFRQGLKQVASFYSQQGHLHTQKIKEANMRASEQILADRNGDLKKGVLDLHGLHIDEAIAALNRTLPDMEQDRSKKHICIITGRGSHSRGGIARLRPSVIAYLKRFRYTFVEEQTGVLKVTLKYRR